MKKRTLPIVSVVVAMLCTSLSANEEIIMPMPDIKTETMNKLIDGKLREQDALRRVTNEHEIIEDSIIDNPASTRTYSFKELVAEIENVHGTKTAKNLMYICQDEDTKVNLTNAQYRDVMSSEDYGDFIQRLSKASRISFAHHVSYNGSSEAIVYMGNQIDGLETNSIVLATPTRAYRYLTRTTLDEYSRATVKLSTDEWFDYLRKVNNSKSLDSQKRAAVLKDMRRHLLSLGTKDGEEYARLLNDNATMEDIEIAYIKRRNGDGNMESIFASYCYLLENNKLTRDLKKIMDVRIIETIEEINRAEGSNRINMQMAIAELNEPTVPMLKSLESAILQSKHRIAFSADKSWEAIAAQRAKEVESEVEKARAGDENKEVKDSPWWKPW